MAPIEISVAVVVIAILAVVLIAVLGWLAFDQFRISRQDRDRD
jgi:hypothetical protein